MKTIYFHGVPGSRHELELLGGNNVDQWSVFDRSKSDGADGTSSFEGRLLGWAMQADRMALNGPVRIVGFSLGAFVAIQVAVRMTQRVASIDLVSPAAPLQSGAFLDKLAGKAVFRMARDHPRLFNAFSALQSLAARKIPTVLVKGLFASAQGADSGLLEDKSFSAAMLINLQEGLGNGLCSYREELRAYVKDWRGDLAEVKSSVTLWQGTQDNWAIPAMSESLAIALPVLAGSHLLVGLSHFSTLKYFLQQSEM
ncbi:MAG: alpha/beta hydrolase [Pontixanthobacter sp.]